MSIPAMAALQTVHYCSTVNRANLVAVRHINVVGHPWFDLSSEAVLFMKLALFASSKHFIISKVISLSL